MGVILKKRVALILYGAILKQVMLKLSLVTRRYLISLSGRLFGTYRFQDYKGAFDLLNASEKTALI